MHCRDFHGKFCEYNNFAIRPKYILQDLCCIKLNNLLNPNAMTQKQLIISLIQQDLKHSQLVLGLDKLGLDASDNHCLELLDIIAELMKVPEGETEHMWSKTYVSLMAKAVQFDVEDASATLRAYAEECYGELRRVGVSF
jgi:hypothetical protein